MAVSYSAATKKNYYGGSMDIQKVDTYMVSHSDYFQTEQSMLLRERLLEADDRKYAILMSLELKNPTTILLMSIFLGGLGVDRFMLGDTGMGILKLLTGGVCGVLTIIDWFTISKKTKELNFNKIMQILA